MREVWEAHEVSTIQDLWKVLKLIKHQLKCLHQHEFKGVQDRITKFKQEVEGIQTELCQDPMNTSLLEAEQEAVKQLRF